MKTAILGWLAAMTLLPAVSLAHEFRPGRRDAGYEPVYRDPSWRETDCCGYWHPAERFDRFDDRWDRPSFRFER